MHHRTLRLRRAFTLIELIVVMTIMVVIATLAVLLLPRMNDNVKVASGADRLQEWLLTARQMARRDGVPTGLRLYYSGATTSISNFVYVQQPEDYLNMDFISAAAGPVGDITGTFTARTTTPSADFLADGILASDYMVLIGEAPQIVRRIKTVGTNTLTFSDTAPDKTTAFTSPPAPPDNCRIVRGPRPYPGIPPMTFPEGVVIHATRSLPTAVQTGTGYFDILFAPSGAVINGSMELISLFVADQDYNDADNPATSPPTIIAVRPRTGFIGAYQMAPGADANAWAAYAREARSSGL